MTALTVEQVEIARADLKTGYQASLWMVDALCDLALAALSERGGEPIGWLLWPSMRFKTNAGIGVYPPVSVKIDPIPLFTRPQAGPGTVSEQNAETGCDEDTCLITEARGAQYRCAGKCAYAGEQNAAQEVASSQLSNNGSSRRLDAETSEEAPPAAAPPCPDAPAEALLLREVVAWSERYPSSRIFSHGEIVKIAAEHDAIVGRIRAHLSGKDKR